MYSVQCTMYQCTFKYPGWANLCSPYFGLYRQFKITKAAEECTLPLPINCVFDHNINCFSYVFNNICFRKRKIQAKDLFFTFLWSYLSAKVG